MPTKIKILLLALFLIIAVVSSFYLFQGEDVALAGASQNLSGFAWSSNIGWVSFNCTNREAETEKTCLDANNPAFNPAINLVDYGVNVNPGGVMSGYAWSDNIGWIDFNPTSGWPEAPNQGGRLDTNTGQVIGWARAVAGGSASSGGWDGWIKLNGTAKDGYSYGISAESIPLGNTTCDWNGLAWGGDDSVAGDLEGDEVIGYISFSGSTYGVKGTGDACKNANAHTLRIDPVSATLNIGDSKQFIAWYDSDGVGLELEVNITTSARWTSSNNAKVGINNQGKAKARRTTSEGAPVVITVSYNGLSATAQIIVNPASSPLSVSCYASPSPALINQPVTWTAVPIGGISPYISYSWSGDISGNAQSISTTYNTTGIKTALVTIIDSVGTTANSSCSVDITSSSSPTRPWWWWIWQEK